MQQSDSELLQVVIGRDDRVRITNTRDYPFSAICALEITATTGRQFVGTGWLVSDDTVITAGHCVYLPEQGGWAKRVRVYPGRNGAGKNDSVFDAANLKSVQGWTEHKKPEADYGAIRLSKSVSDSGRLGYVTLRDRDLLRNLYHIAGYSADKRHGTLWGHVRQLNRVCGNLLCYETDIYGGNSGSPVFFRGDEDDVYVVGIHNYGDISGNSATRITEEVFENIKEWSEC
ncbi:MAG: trypsin-like serine protease [Planctomycetota bacterium]